MYIQIQQLKEKGFSKKQVARQLNTSRNTVKKYWEYAKSIKKFQVHLLYLQKYAFNGELPIKSTVLLLTF